MLKQTPLQQLIFPTRLHVFEYDAMIRIPVTFRSNNNENVQNNHFTAKMGQF